MYHSLQCCIICSSGFPQLILCCTTKRNSWLVPNVTCAVETPLEYKETFTQKGAGPFPTETHTYKQRPWQTSHCSCANTVTVGHRRAVQVPLRVDRTSADGQAFWNDIRQSQYKYRWKDRAYPCVLSECTCNHRATCAEQTSKSLLHN